MGNKVNKQLYDLEYSNLEIAEIIPDMNRLLSNYQIFSQKLKGFYWNIVGQDFFDLRNQFKDLHDRSVININEIAERIRILNQTPPNQVKDYKKLGIIDENGMNIGGFEMVKIVLQDILTLLSILRDCIKSAIETRDYGTEYLAKKIIFGLEKDHRDLVSWLK